MEIVYKQEQYAQDILTLFWAEAQEGASYGFPEIPHVWHGFMGEAYDKVAPRAHTGKTSKLLQASGAVTVIRKGSANTATLLCLNRRSLLTDEEGRAVDFSMPSWAETTPARQLQQEMRSLNKRLHEVESTNTQLLARVRALEAMMSFGPPTTQEADNNKRPTLADLASPLKLTEDDE